MQPRVAHFPPQTMFSVMTLDVEFLLLGVFCLWPTQLLVCLRPLELRKGLCISVPSSAERGRLYISVLCVTLGVLLLHSF